MRSSVWRILDPTLKGTGHDNEAEEAGDAGGTQTPAFVAPAIARRDRQNIVDFVYKFSLTRAASRNSGELFYPNATTVYKKRVKNKADLSDIPLPDLPITSLFLIKIRQS